MKEFTNKKIALNLDFARTALVAYKGIYNRNSYRIDANKFWLISLQMRTFLTILILEAFLKTDDMLHNYTYRFNFKSQTFRYNITNSLVPEYTLEQILLICDITEISITEVKKRVINDILKNLGEQRDKNEYDKFNKLYSNN